MGDLSSNQARSTDNKTVVTTLQPGPIDIIIQRELMKINNAKLEHITLPKSLTKQNASRDLTNNLNTFNDHNNITKNNLPEENTPLLLPES